MIDSGLGAHSSIIGLPISLVNRRANAFRWHAVHMRLGERIRTARDLRGKTQEETAKAAGITQPSLSLLERGGSKSIAGGTLIGLSKFLRVRPEWLWNGKGDMEYAAGLDLSATEVNVIRALRQTSAPPPVVEQRKAQRRKAMDGKNPWAGKRDRREIPDRRSNGQGRD